MDHWMPGVERYDTGRRLTMRGNHDARIFTHHSFEAPYTYSPDCRAAAKYLSSQASDPHFVFHPITGALIQMLPITSGARTLRAKDPKTGVSASTNTWGSIHVQVEVIAFARQPWTNDLTPAGKETLRRLLTFLDTLGITPRWCHGVRPPVYPGPGVKKIQPTESGHYHHAGWVVNDHGDPGAIADPWVVAYTDTEPAPMIRYPSKSNLKTAQFWRDLEAVIRSEGFEVYCGRSHYDAGKCAPGKHPHGTGSRHFAGRALDFGRDYETAVSARERIYVSAKIRMLRDYYGSEMGWVFDRGPGDHDDHGHVQDEPNKVNGRLWDNTLATVTMYGDRGAAVRAWQASLKEVGHTLGVDGVYGLQTFWATRSWQARSGLTVDGIIGAGSRTEMARQLTPEPTPEPTPAPDPKPTPPKPDLAPFRLAGKSAFHTAAAIAHHRFPDGAATVYLALIDSPDGVAAAGISDGPVLFVTADRLPAVTAATIRALRPQNVYAVGGPGAVPDAVLEEALNISKEYQQS